MLVITSTFTIESIVDDVQLLIRKMEVSTQIQSIPYANQLFAQLLDPESLTQKNLSGINLLLIRLQDLVNGDDHTQLQNLQLILEDILKRSSLKWIICLCPDVLASQQNINNYDTLKKETANFFSNLSDQKNSFYIDFGCVNELYCVDRYENEDLSLIENIPYNPIFSGALSAAIVRKVYMLMSIPYKVVVLDCDNTLWKGVCGEEPVEVTPIYQEFQRLIIKQYEAGVLICLCSKNNAMDVFRVFDHHPDMVLKKEHIVKHRINWQDKSNNIVSLAEELNLSLDSIIFIDDNPVECDKVRSTLPQVLTMQFPLRENNIREMLAHFWPFDRVQQTQTDQERTRLYLIEERRKTDKIAQLSVDRKLTLQQYLLSIELRVDVQPINQSSPEILRIAQLMTKTNQFNITAKSDRAYTEQDVRQQLQHATILFAKFTDKYNATPDLVGVAIYQVNNSLLNVTDFLLSCRALGKNIEYFLLDYLVDVAKKKNIMHINFDFTKRLQRQEGIDYLKNRPALDFLKSLPHEQSVVGNGITFKVNANTVYSASQKAQHQLVSQVQVPLTSSSKQVAVTSSSRAAPVTFFVELSSPQRALEMIKCWRQQHRSVISDKVVESAKNQVESVLKCSLESLLSITPIGTLDNLVEFGLNSIKALQLSAVIKKEYNFFISPNELLYRYKTIRELSDFINSSDSQIVLSDIVSAEESYDYPLSYSQYELWLIQQMKPHSSQYNVCMAWELQGELNKEALEESYLALLSRHEILRTVYGDESPRQRIVPYKDIDFSISMEKISHYNLLPDIIKREASRPYNFSEDLALRVCLVRLGVNQHALIVTLPHISIDGYSFNRMIKETNELYLDFLYKKQPEKNETLLQYKDFASWQRKNISSSYLENHCSYWRKQLINFPVVGLPILPANGTSVSDRTKAVGRIPFTLNKNVVSQLTGLASYQRTTLYCVLLSIFSIFLSKYNNEKDVAFGTLLSGRDCYGLAELLGYFANLTIFRISLEEPCLSFENVIERAKCVLDETVLHQEFPFEQLTKLLNHQGVQGTRNLIKTVFIFQNYEHYQLSFPNVTTKSLLGKNDEIMLSDYCNPKFDIIFCMSHINGVLEGVVEYDAHLFQSTTISRYLEHFERLITILSYNSSLPVSQLSLMSLQEQAALVNAKFTNYTEQPLHRIFELQSHRSLKHTALSFPHLDDLTYTYQELNQLANRLGHYLYSQGVCQGKTVAILGQADQPEMIISLLAILKSGAAYAPISLETPQKRIEHILRHVDLLLISEISNDLKTSGIVNVTQVLMIVIHNAIDKENFYPDWGDDNLNIPVARDEAAYAIHTSGSTGVPKQVTLPHQTITNLIDWQAKRQTTSRRQRIAQYSSFAFDVFTQELFFALLNGHALFLLRQEDKKSMENLSSFLLNYKINQIFMPVAVLSAFSLKNQLVFNDLNEIIVAGESLKVTPSIRHFFFNNNHITLCNQYGPSESHVVTELRLQGNSNDWLASPAIGKAIQNTECFILDSDYELLTIGTVGQLYISGEGLSLGYPLQPELTEKKFITISHPVTKKPIRCYCSGDLAFFDEAYQLHYVGRVDQQVKKSGYRIELGEIENCAAKYPGVHSVTVDFFQQHQEIHIYLVLEENTKKERFDFNALQSYLMSYLSPVMIPSNYTIVSAIPLNQNGKIDKKSLMQLAHPDQFSLEPTYFEPHTVIEKKLTMLFCESLGVERLKLYETLFSQGLDSLHSVRIKNKINELFNIRLSLDKLLSIGNIKNLAEWVDSCMNKESFLTENNDNNHSENSLIPLNVADSNFTLFLVHPIGGTAFCYSYLARQLDPRWSCYAIQDPSINEQKVLFNDIFEMASYYVTMIKQVQNKGPYTLGGYSMGGLVCFEIVKQLKKIGELVNLVILFDTWVVPALDDEQALIVKERLQNNFDNERKKQLDGEQYYNLWRQLVVNRVEKFILNYKIEKIEQPYMLFRTRYPDPKLFAYLVACTALSNVEPIDYQLDCDHSEILSEENSSAIVGKLNPVLARLASGSKAPVVNPVAFFGLYAKSHNFLRESSQELLKIPDSSLLFTSS